MKAGVVVFPGSNCDLDAYHLVRDILGQRAEYVWHGETAPGVYDLLILPGGFSYGDYLRSGAIARFSPVMDAVAAHAAAGGLVLGICNGFQILTEAGLLPGALYRNRHLQFRCKQTYIRVENNRLPFTGLAGDKQILKIPVAHGDGCYYIPEDELAGLEERGQVVFRYTDSSGSPTKKANPNGSMSNIAGVCSEEGNVLGLMPHPERAGEDVLGSSDGLIIFKSILDYIGTGEVSRRG